MKKSVQKWTVGMNGQAAFGNADAFVRSRGRQNGFIWTPVTASTNIRYEPPSSLRLVVFFHCPILTDVVAASFT